MNVSVIVPCYNESQNISILLDELFKCFSDNEITGEVIVVDDDSPDMTWELVEHYKERTHHNLVIIRRINERGLSSAVLEGIKHAKGRIIGVMDADLSHPPSKIPDMVKLIENKRADFVIGSRYVKGGMFNKWPLRRKLASRVATCLAKPLVALSDPMSGYFFFEKEKIAQCPLNPRGFKIGLELLVKGSFTRIEEIPILFKDRLHGESKLTCWVIVDYLVQVIALLMYKYVVVNQFIKFSLVGGSGILVNLFVYSTLLKYVSLYYVLAATMSFLVANVWNYCLNRVWTFDMAHERRIVHSYVKFLLICTLGYLINMSALFYFVEIVQLGKITAQILAILLATFNNFMGSRKWVFSESDSLDSN